LDGATRDDENTGGCFMNDEFLRTKLRRVARRYQWVAVWRTLSACWAVAALVGVGLVALQRATGWAPPLLIPSLAALAAGAATALVIFQFSKAPDYRWIARKIEARHPELNGLLLTAVQQHLERSEEPGYLQYRVLQEATARSQEQDWRQVVPVSRLVAMQGLHLAALACFAVALAGLRVNPILGEAPRWISSDGVAVTPGDASIERGDSLVVLARFGGALPPAVSMVVRESGAAARAIPLVKSLADPVFGGSVPEVANDFTYHLEYRGQRTREFKVTVFEHPRLVRADVDFKFPDYTKLPPKHVEDTRRVSAVQGTKLDFALQLNKPVASAKLVARDGKKTAIPLVVSPHQAIATLPAFVPEKSQTYDLQLVDAEGRANKVSAPFVIDVQPNRTPELRIASPRGDVRPSALEEVTFEGTVWDDFGAAAYGLAFTVAGSEPKFIEFGRDAAGKEKRTFTHLLKLEELSAKPDDLISWYVWADDIGPDGKVRRTSGDMYFAEVRPFDEIFRESQNMESPEGEESPPGQGNQNRKLTELQKQIISATWKLQRDGATPKYAADAKVVADSQAQALEQAGEAQEKARAPREQALWKSATRQMEKAVEKLKEAATKPGPLAQALPAEQAAYQALLKLQARETSVTRAQRKQGKGGGGKQGNQRQIDQLDLKQSENRYETQRQAKAPQNQERREELAVMNRLQELARRQQDLNEKLKELQASLQEARTEQEREEIKRRLKRLQEEQQQMVADVDEVRQRMDRQENQSRMSNERQQLDQTREDVQRAAEAAAAGSVAQALASGTRAQRQLQQLREDMRKENASQFAEEMRDMRNDARELSREQEQLGQKLDALTETKNQRRTLSDSGENKELGEKLAEQKERMNKLVDRATQVSEQAENAEPLLSRQLYDSIRKLSQDDANALKQARQELMNSGKMTRELYDRLQKSSESETGGKTLDLTREMLREGYLSQATQAGQRARSGIDELKRGVERAAESVLGDEAEQLRMAQSELDLLTEQLQREIAQAQGRGQGESRPGQRPGARDAKGDRRQAGTQPGAQPGEGRESTPAAGEPGAESQEGQPGQPGQRGGQQPGRQPGQRGERQTQVAEAGQPNAQEGQQPGGQQPGEAQSPGGQGGQGGGQQANADGQPRADDPNSKSPPARGRGQLAGGRGGRNQGGPRDGPLSVDDLLNRGPDVGGDGRGGWGDGAWNGGAWNGGPLTGEEFARWNERLRDVEELLDTPELRNAVATARERARMLRRDLRQDLKKPDWTVVQLQIVKPLVEVRNRVAEELARRDPKDSLAPIDRDPVPNRFAESVRRYYEELCKDKPEAPR
jgi:hypothetical protein